MLSITSVLAAEIVVGDVADGDPGHYVGRDSHCVHPLPKWHTFVCHVPDNR
jgi:hypothetical protein